MTDGESHPAREAAAAFREAAEAMEDVPISYVSAGERESLSDLKKNLNNWADQLDSRRDNEVSRS